MPDALLTVRNLSKSFAGVQALDQVNLTIEKGEIRCLVGENGCGKSTLIKLIAGVETPTEGRIVIDGREYRQLRPIDAIREGIQVIYQDFSLFPNLGVAENIAFNYQLAQNRRLVSWREVQRVARAAVDKIGVRLDLDARVEDLPVADKQIVAICRAIIQRARLVIMDEPTTALTEKEVRALFGVIKTLQSEGISILFVSHKLNEVFEISEKITILRNGRNAADGPTAGFNRGTLVQYMTGRDIREASFQSRAAADVASPLLSVKRLSRWGRFDDVCFEVNPGEILGITGLLGSGRTELALALFGIRPADSGQIAVDGKPVRVRSVRDAILNGIGYVPEDRLTEGLFLERPISKNIGASTIRRLLGRRRLIDVPAFYQQAERWMSDLKIASPSHQLPVKSLSGGNQQRVVLAKWLATEPRILILNGPTVGVDVGSKADIHQIIRGLAAQGMGVILISDDLPEVLQNCSRILVMRRGRIVAELPAGGTTEAELSQHLTSVHCPPTPHSTSV